MSEEEIPAKDEGADEHFQRAGETLAAARIEKGMSLEQVSVQLKLSMKYLQALEACHYDQLPGTTFTRGYLRSYARLVGVDENHVLNLFGETVQADEQVARLLQEQDRTIEAHSPLDGKWLIIISVILLLSFIVGSVYWWRNTGQSQGRATLENPVMIQEESSDTWEETASDSSQSEPAVFESENEEEEVSAPAPVVSDLIGEVSALQQNNPGPADGSKPVNGSKPANGSEPVGVFVEPAEAPAAAVEPSRVTPLPGDDLLVVRFNDDCWVEVTDSAGAILYSALKTGSGELRLTGHAPLSIVFGNVGSITDIHFNGEPVKVNFPASRSNIGRLTLD